MTDSPIRWGILGAANFALKHMGPALHAASGAELAAVASSSAEKVAKFAQFAPGLRHHDSYDALLDDPEIDAVYIPLPNHLHVEWGIKALEAGKPVLIEKPVGMNVAEIDRLIAARDAAGLLAAEAFMIIHHPQWQRAKALLESGAIGNLCHVNAVFSYFNDDAGNIRNQADIGGGGLRDIGCYVLGGARYVTGQEPLSLDYARIQMQDGVDVFADMGFAFEGFTFQGYTGTRMAPRQEVHFHGDRGVISLSCPFNAGVFDQAEVVLSRPDLTREVMRFPGVNQYVRQVEAFGRALRSSESYAWPLEQARGLQAMIDQVLARA
ncbi:Gfo/Idh/MocA family protein [Shimia marina]|uniref:Glucose--fructose oxidoreductase n=1 Tax=Shimia marina TaxID=321267 RepID=A0A0P1FGS8_9RHOB|nr:Gfo/Idh/MocA family oxidoreductase [Shimia marina]CUH53265.1 Glucose--fructose oxidoreductase precursor [Shimia marina]SFD81186.1 Predicted dehydrogenase [Shimia marina]